MDADTITIAMARHAPAGFAIAGGWCPLLNDENDKIFMGADVQ